jgi:hypothetical protein
MKITIRLLGAILLLGITALAQEFPRAELGIDYSYARYNPSHAYIKNGHSLNGAGGSITYNFNEYLGLKMELTGYGSNSQTFNIPPGQARNCPSGCFGRANGNLFTYLFGPQIKVRAHGFHPYGHLLLGGAHSNIYSNLNHLSGYVGNSPNPAGNTFAMIFGGGVDIPINKTVEIRPGEIDYLYTRFNNSYTGAQSSLRYQAGILFNLGHTPQ